MVVLYRILNESQWDDFALKTLNILSVRKTSVNKLFISPAQNGERKEEKMKRKKAPGGGAFFLRVILPRGTYGNILCRPPEVPRQFCIINRKGEK